MSTIEKESKKMREGQTVWLDAVDRTSASLKGAARSIANTLGASRPVVEEQLFPPATAFSDLHIYQSVKKYNSIIEMFGLRNPSIERMRAGLGPRPSVRVVNSSTSPPMTT